LATVIGKLFKTKPAHKPIVSRPRHWPVVQLSRNRKQFISEVVTESIEKIKILAKEKSSLVEEIETVLFREKLRIEKNPWRVDPPDEKAFWKNVRTRLLNISDVSEGNDCDAENILRDIVTRYAEEIAGNFKPSHYRVAREVVKFGFARLLNAYGVKGWRGIWSTQLNLQDKIKVNGDVELLRKVAKRGTLVMVPTHFSHLDSVLIGWIIYFLGLPPFIYGAGLNLFNIRIFSYFMNSLGAYKVDRRKKNLIYLETLKAYSNLALRKGCHSLFFPGGTRSRSGKIEEHLKLGLLGTTVEAQRSILENNPGDNFQKIFIVPVALNYHFVLEAPAMITDYLERKGQERFYVEKDEYTTSYKIIKFMIKFFTQRSNISASIGHPIDLFGNRVNSAGESIGKQGELIDIRDYFTFIDEISVDLQREAEYTRRLSQIIVDEFHRINEVFSSHLVAFTAFGLLKKEYQSLDLFHLLRLSEEDRIIPYNKFVASFKVLRKRLFELEKLGKVNISPHLKGPVDEVIEYGISNVGMYHARRPLKQNEDGNITSQDLTLLYYYRNRLSGYELEAYV